ncbi:elongation factor P hydroxylase [Salinicola endophyticus]|uniref:Elongation factor P hydroxylase n=1 Tax=Salinicola endophyticus TaxID=1949083 RepID=A0ABY8FR36_9GAMM|nr:elongation factor P hydroxylase [Salinicola endophyticus]WFF43241.1 elongation factor P hydroxylase [Salinicola endophyticus]
MLHAIDDVIALFDGVFAETFNTRLIKGDDEPIYLPADGDVGYHRIVFAHGFFASALHEVSHWCIAGAARRQLEDYGYWYEPDGRDAGQQAAFEQVEVAPQALERLLCEACAKSFEVSVDNLDGVTVDRQAFAAQVAARAERYRDQGLPLRADAFVTTLRAFYRQGEPRAVAITAGRARLKTALTSA